MGLPKRNLLISLSFTRTQMVGFCAYRERVRSPSGFALFHGASHVRPTHAALEGKLPNDSERPHQLCGACEWRHHWTLKFDTANLLQDITELAGNINEIDRLNYLWISLHILAPPEETLFYLKFAVICPNGKQSQKGCLITPSWYGSTQSMVPQCHLLRLGLDDICVTFPWLLRYW